MVCFDLRLNTFVSILHKSWSSVERAT